MKNMISKMIIAGIVVGMILNGDITTAAGKILNVSKKKVTVSVGNSVKVRYKASAKVKAVSSKKKVARVTVKKKYIVIKGYKKGKTVVTVSCKNNKSDKAKKVKINVTVKAKGPTPLITASPRPTANPDDVYRTARELGPLAKSVNKFGMQVYGGVRSDKNTFISPFSIYTALAMLTNGANSNTRTELMNVLGITNLDEINNSMKTYCAGSMDKSVTFNVANSLWLSKALVTANNIDQAFINPLKENYNSDVYKDVDFGDSKTVDMVNDWVNKKTEGMIKKLADNLDPRTRAIIMNALYFQGRWHDSFYEGNTKDEIFHSVDGDRTVKMMNRSGTCRYFNNDTFRGIELDYGASRNYAMDIILTSDSAVSTTACWNALTPEEKALQFMEFDNRATSKRIRNLKLPKFDMEYQTTNLVGVLASLGIKDAFSPEKADFSNIANGVYVSDVLHKTALSVDEEGSKAAAITAIMMEVTAVMPNEQQEEIDFIVDRPFVFAIRDKVSGMILFIGEVNSL